MARLGNHLRRRWRGWRGAAWWPAVLLIIVQLASGMRDIPQFAFFLIYLQEELGLVPVAISGVVAAAQVAGMLTALLGGAITARQGSKGVLLWGLLLSGVSSLVFQVHSLWPVVLLWLVGGAGMALVTIGGASYLTGLAARASLGVLAAYFALSMTIGGALGNPMAALLIERGGFGAFGWAAVTLSAATILVVALWLAPLHDRAPGSLPLRSFGADALAMARRPQMRRLIGLRSLPTLFYGMLSVLIPLMLNDLSGSKVLVAAYGTTTLVVASATQLLAGRAADRWGARLPTQVAYTTIVLAGLGLGVSAGSVVGIFLFGVLGIAAAWALSTLMYLWVADGLPRPEHPATFGLLHAVWSLSMIAGSLLGGWFVRTAPGLPFLLAGLLNLAAVFLAAAYYRRIE